MIQGRLRPMRPPRINGLVKFFDHLHHGLRANYVATGSRSRTAGRLLPNVRGESYADGRFRASAASACCQLPTTQKMIVLKTAWIKMAYVFLTILWTVHAFSGFFFLARSAPLSAAIDRFARPVHRGATVR